MEQKKINYNWDALRGTGVDDMEYVRVLNIDPNLAYTPEFLDKMLELTYEEDIASGLSRAKAAELRSENIQYTKLLLADNGLLEYWKPKVE